MDRDRLLELDRALNGFFRRMAGEMSHLLERGLTASQHAVLRLVSRRPGCHVGEVARALGITDSAASAICDRMVRDGLLRRRRDPEDRRRVVVSLTASGGELLDKAEEARLMAFNRHFASLPPEDLDSLVRIFTRLGAGREQPDKD